MKKLIQNNVINRKYIKFYSPGNVTNFFYRKFVIKQASDFVVPP